MKARKKPEEDSMVIESMEVFDPEDTVSDSSPQERWMHGIMNIGLLAFCLLFWAFVAWLIFG